MKINAKGQSSSFYSCPYSSSSLCSLYSVWLINDSCSTGRRTAAEKRDSGTDSGTDGERGQVLLSRGYLCVEGSSCLYSSSSLSLAARLLWLLLFNIEPVAESVRPPLYVFFLFFAPCNTHSTKLLHATTIVYSTAVSLPLPLSLAFVLFCSSMRNHLFFSQDSTTLCPVVPWYCPGSALETFCVHSYLNLSCGFSHCCHSSAVSAVSEKRLLRSFSRCTQGCGWTAKKSERERERKGEKELIPRGLQGFQVLSTVMPMQSASNWVLAQNLKYFWAALERSFKQEILERAATNWSGTKASKLSKKI